MVLRLCRRDAVFRPRNTYLTRWTQLKLCRVSSIITDSVLVWSYQDSNLPGSGHLGSVRNRNLSLPKAYLRRCQPILLLSSSNPPTTSPPLPLTFLLPRTHCYASPDLPTLMIFKSPIAILFSLAITMSASAAPVVFSSLSERDVWAPPVTNPNPGTVWKIGSSQTVTWYVERAWPRFVT